MRELSAAALLTRTKSPASFCTVTATGRRSRTLRSSSACVPCPLLDLTMLIAQVGRQLVFGLHLSMLAQIRQHRCKQGESPQG